MALLSRLMFENFGPFERAELELAPFSVLVGPNDSGKSSVLNAIRAMGGLAAREADLEGAQPTRPRRGAAEVRIELAGSRQGAPWDVSFRSPSLRLWTGKTEVIATLDGLRVGDPGPIVKLPPEVLPYGSRVPPYGILEKDLTTDSGPTPLTERLNSAGRSLRGITYHRFNPSSLRRASAAWTEGANWPTLSEDGFGLPTLLASLAHRAPRSFIRLEDAFSAQVSTLAGFRVVETSVPTIDGGAKIAGFQLQFKLSGGGELTPSEVSDGTMLLLAMLALAHSPNPPEVLLVEEPENGVHPSRLQEIVRVFRGLSSEGGSNGPTQVVMTTHAPYLLDAMRPEEVFFCHRLADGRATCTRLADVPGVREELEYKLLGELWAEHGEAELYRRWAAARAAE